MYDNYFILYYVYYVSLYYIILYYINIYLWNLLSMTWRGNFEESAVINSYVCIELFGSLNSFEIMNSLSCELESLETSAKSLLFHFNPVLITAFRRTSVTGSQVVSRKTHSQLQLVKKVLQENYWTAFSNVWAVVVKENSKVTDEGSDDSFMFARGGQRRAYF